MPWANFFLLFISKERTNMVVPWAADVWSRQVLLLHKYWWNQLTSHFLRDQPNSILRLGSSLDKSGNNSSLYDVRQFTPCAQVVDWSCVRRVSDSRPATLLSYGRTPAWPSSVTATWAVCPHTALWRLRGRVSEKSSSRWRPGFDRDEKTWAPRTHNQNQKQNFLFVQVIFTRNFSLPCKHRTQTKY